MNSTFGTDFGVTASTPDLGITVAVSVFGVAFAATTAVFVTCTGSTFVVNLASHKLYLAITARTLCLNHTLESYSLLSSFNLHNSQASNHQSGVYQTSLFVQELKSFHLTFDKLTRALLILIQLRFNSLGASISFIIFNNSSLSCIS